MKSRDLFIEMVGFPSEVLIFERICLIVKLIVETTRAGGTNLELSRRRIWKFDQQVSSNKPLSTVESLPFLAEGIAAKESSKRTLLSSDRTAALSSRYPRLVLQISDSRQKQL